jgi:hypothetical protein
LIIPKTYGVPVAFLGVPNTELPAAAAAVVLLAAGVLEAPELLELLELQPAATSPVTASATALSHMGRFIFASFVMVESSVRVLGFGWKRPPQAAVSPR